MVPVAGANSLRAIIMPVGLVFRAGGGFARQARPQSRSRYFWAHTETNVRPCCPYPNPLSRGGPNSCAGLTLTRTPLVASLGRELNDDSARTSNPRSSHDSSNCAFDASFPPPAASMTSPVVLKAFKDLPAAPGTCAPLRESSGIDYLEA
jgi:hypothetical protein